MQSQQNLNSFKRLKLILGNQTVKKLSQLTILLVGVGGIGCQVLKNLSKHPIKKVVIIDLDVIQLSNLNRQFYFQKNHILQSKAKVAKKQVLKFTHNLNIEAIEGNIYDKKFDNYRFYNQFDLVISALDSIKARQKLAKNCTKFGKVLIDAGTSGYNGQSYPSIRFVNSCHNCNPVQQQQSFAVCTIRTKPERSIHCGIYAKNIYQQLFGRHEGDFLSKQIKQIKQKMVNLKQEKDKQLIAQMGIKLFDYLFCDQFSFFQNLQSENNLQITKLKYIQTLPLLKESIKLSNVCSQKEKHTQNQSQNNHNQNDFKQQLEGNLQNIGVYTQIFLSKFNKLVLRSLCPERSIRPPYTYNKDDQDCSLFVLCLANLRIFNFKSKNNKLKYLTHQQCQRMLGGLIPAIASTNSMAASLQTKLTIDYISKNPLTAKYLTISQYSSSKIQSSWLSLPNRQCKICSPRHLYYEISCNLQRRIFEQLQLFTKQNCYSFGRDLYCQNLILLKNGNGTYQQKNKSKKLNFKSELLVYETLTLQYLPNSLTDIWIQITLIHQSNADNFQILNPQQIKNTIQALQNLLNSAQQKKIFKIPPKVQTQIQQTYENWETISIE